MWKVGLGSDVFNIRTGRTAISQLTVNTPSSLSIVGTLLYLFMSSFSLIKVGLCTALFLKNCLHAGHKCWSSSYTQWKCSSTLSPWHVICRIWSELCIIKLLEVRVFIYPLFFGLAAFDELKSGILPTLSLMCNQLYVVCEHGNASQSFLLFDRVAFGNLPFFTMEWSLLTADKAHLTETDDGLFKMRSNCFKWVVFSISNWINL